MEGSNYANYFTKPQIQASSGVSYSTRFSNLTESAVNALHLSHCGGCAHSSSGAPPLSPSTGMESPFSESTLSASMSGSQSDASITDVGSGLEFEFEFDGDIYLTNHTVADDEVSSGESRIELQAMSAAPHESSLDADIALFLSEGPLY